MNIDRIVEFNTRQNRVLIIESLEMELNIKNETSRLRAVVLGTAESCGPVPKVEECYDPKSLENVLAGTYPTEDDMKREMQAFDEVLKKYGVKVYRPEEYDLHPLTIRKWHRNQSSRLRECTLLPRHVNR